MNKQETVMPKEIPWFEKPLSSRVAAILYPAHTDDETRRQMQRIADANGKPSPQQVAKALRDKR
jgi:hypothetical protein